MVELMLILLYVFFEDCWNCIGIKGDGSCFELVYYICCLNCLIFVCVVLQQLDWVEVFCEVVQQWVCVGVVEEDQEDCSVLVLVLVVCIVGEWLVIVMFVVQEVVGSWFLYSLLYQCNIVIVGVVNICGSLCICVLLVWVFQLFDDVLVFYLLVVVYEGQILVFLVEEVVGVYCYVVDSLVLVLIMLVQVVIQYMCGMVEWCGCCIGLFDYELLFYVFNWSMI